MTSHPSLTVGLKKPRLTLLPEARERECPLGTPITQKLGEIAGEWSGQRGLQNLKVEENNKTMVLGFKIQE